jgi:hypothetical protein
MRLRNAASIAALLALTAGARFPSTQAGITMPQRLTDQVAAEGSAPVIVGVRMAFTPEGDLGGPDDVARQREAIERAIDDVADRVVTAGMTVYRRFSFIPYFTTRVTAAQLAELATLPGVASIEEDRVTYPVLASSVPLIGANTSHAAGFTGSGWSVAILDTGVEKTHAFMGGRVTAEACYSNAGGAGGLTSVCPGGVTSSTAVGSGVNCSASMPQCFHGTHVAGIAAGAAGVNGNIPLGGVAPGANIIAMQVFSRTDSATTCQGAPGGVPPCVVSFTSDQIAALQQVLVIAGAGNVNGVAAANMSLGDASSNATNCDAANGALKTAIDNLASIGIATAIASGNNSVTTGVAFPACISSAVSVGATNDSDVIASFTSRFPGMVDLMAPGVSITSSTTGGVYITAQGTSMAAPHVAGAWAVLKQAVPTAGVAQTLSVLQSTGVPVGTDMYPRISVNAARLALMAAPPPPPPPPAPTAPGTPAAPTIAGSGNNVTINWAIPAAGGAPTSYTIRGRVTCGGAIIATLPVGNVLSFTVSVPNGSFCVTVQATNAVGSSAESAGTTFTSPIVAPPPGPPTGLNVTVTGTEAVFRWTVPSTGGTVTGYVLMAALTPGGPIIASLPFPVFATPAARVINIPVGTFFVKLAATNEGGTSSASNEVQVIVAGLQPPAAPVMNAAVVVGRTVTLSWVAGAGSVPTSYTILARLSAAGPVIASVSATGTSATFSNVASGTYFVTVTAQNAQGTSAASNQITLVVP